MNEQERRVLLDVARRSIGEALAGGKYKPDIPVEGALSERRGAFVTLTREGRLRGCIGRIVADEPVVLVVAAMAAAAARDDYRFQPLEPSELDKVRIEISVLTPFRAVGRPSEIEVGRHGLMIRQGRQSGLLLPQVAAKEGWDAERFLEETCRKAGLPKTAWREGASIESFEAEVWGEEEG